MSDLNWQHVETILDEALTLKRDERQSFIDRKCAGNNKLKTEVLKLLESIYASEGWLQDPDTFKQTIYKEIAEDVETLSGGRSLMGKQVGNYTIREKIGRGGMGSVYLAERSDEDFDHRVAIKIIRHGLATASNIRRFKREQQILANLNHPGIARLFDGGITDDGFPYIIMEYVDGIPIDVYCKQHGCTIDQKIDLFQQVLKAVRHAHENLIIHRDLKPSNILVTPSATVKVLDFGISKLLDEDESPSLTRTGARLLTPRYAAPEQIKEQNITTATDLYALGCVFYELLSGCSPFDFDDLSRYEFEQNILKKEPAKPSSIIDSSKTKSKVQGDLDAISLKALRKEPEKRYRVVNDFLNDLENYKKGLAVSAHRDSFSYRGGKFLRRHKQGVAVAAGILLLIFGFAGFYTWRITEERNQAQLEAQRAEAAITFLGNLFKSNDPSVSGARDLPASTLLERGRERIDTLNNAKVRANMMVVIGKAYSDLGFSDKSNRILDQAIAQSKKTFGDTAIETYNALMARGDTEAAAQNHDLALPYYRASHQIIAPVKKNHKLEYVETLQSLAETMRFTGKLDSAEMLISKAGKFQQKYGLDNKNDLQQTKGIQALILRKQGKLDQANELYLDIVNQINPANKTDSLHLAAYYNNMAFIYIDQKRYAKAKKYLQKSLTINEDIRPSHPRTLMTRSNLIGTLRKQGDNDKAIELLQENIKHTKEKFSEDHWQTAKKYGYLGYILTTENDLLNGETYLRKSAQIYSKTIGRNHKWTAIAWGKLAANLHLQDRYRSADSLMEANYKILENKSSALRAVNIGQIEDLISLYQNQGEEFSEVIGRYQKLIDQYKN
jgi:serine/threonine-protein kinase